MLVVLAGVLFVHAMLVALPPKEPPRTGLVRTAILDGLTPIERLFDVTIHGVASLWRDYFALLDTRRENERLHSEVSALKMLIEQNRESTMEARRLRRLFDLEPLSDGERVVARVIGADTTFARQTITIDKGTRAGVRAGVSVMTPDGIVGRVIHAGHFAAIVQLISDPESAVGVTIRDSRIQGIARGDGTRYLQLDHVDDHLPLEPGDELVTSGTDQIYPKGLPLGVIASVGIVQDLMRTARIAPVADLGRLEEVLCLIQRGDRTQLLEGLREAVPMPGR